VARMEADTGTSHLASKGPLNVIVSRRFRAWNRRDERNPHTGVSMLGLIIQNQ